MRQIIASGFLAYLALVPPFFLDSVVTIGRPGGNGERQWVASGFLYGDQVTPGVDQYRVYLVTNQHVLANLDIAYLRFNPSGNGPAREYDLQLRDPKGTKIWFTPTDSKIDVAVIPINAKFLKDQGIQFAWFKSDSDVADRAKSTELGISEGDGVYAFGFPMGLVGGERNFVIVRRGSIARIKDTLAGRSNEFLIDMFLFPGNSGGPVVLKPELMAIEGTKSLDRSYLIGVVRESLSYRDVAVSIQTQQPRIIFDENSGLAGIIPIDFVKDAIREHIKTLK
jgi:S1-C subfamily serine protease